MKDYNDDRPEEEEEELKLSRDGVSIPTVAAIFLDWGITSVPKKRWVGKPKVYA
jgi:hypothetical protein